jgi:hypothetical protein
MLWNAATGPSLRSLWRWGELGKEAGGKLFAKSFPPAPPLQKLLMHASDRQVHVPATSGQRLKSIQMV